MKYLKIVYILLLLLLLQACSNSTGNLSGEKLAVQIDIRQLSDVETVKKYENQLIQFSSKFDGIEFDLNIPDALTSYRLAHFFVKVTRLESGDPYILIPTSNTLVYSLDSNDPITIQGEVKIINDIVCLLVSNIRRESLIRK